MYCAHFENDCHRIPLICKASLIPINIFQGLQGTEAILLQSSNALWNVIKNQKYQLWSTKFKFLITRKEYWTGVCINSYFHCYRISLLWKTFNFICYSGTHTLWLYEIHLVKPMMIIQQQKKCPTFCTHYPLPSGWTLDVSLSTVATNINQHFREICHNSRQRKT